MLSPFSVAGSFVVYSCEKLKFLEGYLSWFDAKLMI